MKTPHDQYGNPIIVGDVITYPVQLGSTLSMITAIVREIGERNAVHHYFDPKQNKNILVINVSIIVPSVPSAEHNWTTLYSVRNSQLTGTTNATIVDPTYLPSDMGRWVIRVLEEQRSKG